MACLPSLVLLSLGLAVVSCGTLRKYEMCQDDLTRQSMFDRLSSTTTTFSLQTMIQVVSPHHNYLLQDRKICAQGFKHVVSYSGTRAQEDTSGKWKVEYDIQFPNNTRFCSASQFSVEHTCSGLCTNLFLTSEIHGKPLKLAPAVNGSVRGEVVVESPLYIYYCIDQSTYRKPVFLLNITDSKATSSSPQRPSSNWSSWRSGSQHHYIPISSSHHSTGAIVGGGGAGSFGFIVVCFVCLRRKRRVVRGDTAPLPVASGGQAPATGMPVVVHTPSRGRVLRPGPSTAPPDPSISRPRPIGHRSDQPTDLPPPEGVVPQPPPYSEPGPNTASPDPSISRPRPIGHRSDQPTDLPPPEGVVPQPPPYSEV